MASELNHHVGYSRENECWFVRFYPYQTEQQAIEAIAEFTRPTPVAPVSPDATGKCGELFRLSLVNGGGLEPNPNGNYVRFSQVEELLAAERAENAELKRDRRFKQHVIDGLVVDKENLKADNAAKDARIKELEEAHDHWMQENIRNLKKAQDTEAKLAAAEKALEPIARLEIPSKPQGNAGAYSIRHKDILEARAALGGKPS